jgi:hypothetical protein
MGYYYSIIESTLTVPADKADDAYEALKAALSDDPYRDATDESDLPGVLGLLDIGAFTNDEGDISIYRGSSKYYYQMRRLDAIAPFLAEGGYAIWQGEGGDLLRQVVSRGFIVEQQGTVTFS